MNPVRPLRIGAIEIRPPLALAPMAGVTNALFRRLFKPFGLGLTVSEFVSAQSLVRMNARTLEMIDVYPEERPTAVQLHGNDPDVMARAARFVEECGADIVDINFGCPAPKIVKGGDGAAILRDPDLAVRICDAVRRAVVKVPVTVKMRLGWEADNFTFLEIAKRAEAVGIDAFTLHGRYGKQFYKGSSDWSYIARLKSELRVPVIGNGDVGSADDALRRLGETGVDAIMVGRAALGDPWLVARISAAMRGLAPPPAPSVVERVDFARAHLDAMVERYGEKSGILQMRKHLGWYLKGVRDASSLRERINHAPTAPEVREILDDARTRELEPDGSDKDEALAAAL
ncbi:MAG: tRNA dihydrouridine synthase DusB [Candidatus Eremiobacteraeota bacterium]|nr:tRNA dihydrouridine synthase DusB [Candidatus Eremiobacteraeota bacterium]MBV8366380.1 tRNA dihydrouridine synthase DusB [Candidatus Eremiobacteraeota bacterium]